jgi:hypothetical protein
VTKGATEQRRGVSDLSPRAAWLAWSLAGLTVAMFLAIIAFYVFVRSAQVPTTLGTGLTLIELLVGVPVLAFPIVGALIASRRPHNPIGWILLADGLLWMLSNMLDYYSIYGVAHPGSVPFPVAITALSQWLWVPPVGLLGVYLILLFPDGKLPSRRWVSLAWLSGAVMVLFGVSVILAPGPLEGHPGVRNPFGLEGHPWLVDAAIVIVLLLPLCILASAMSLVLRYRSSGGEVRQQIKWIVFAASFVGIVSVSLMVISLIELNFTPESWGSADTAPLWVGLLYYVWLLSFAGVPVAVGIAVLRFRLYDIDLIINRTLVYGALTATLVGLYFGTIVLLQRLFVALTGEKSTLAVVASTLLIAALFNPLRRRIQSFIDRRFYRSKYDAAKTLEAYSAKLRDETDLDALSDDLVGVVRETMQPAHISLWLRSEAAHKGEQTD